MIKPIVEAIVKPLTRIVEGISERKTNKQEAKATVERILTEASADNSVIAGQIALANTINQNSSIKDEYALLVLTMPVVLGMFMGVLEAFGAVEAGMTESVMSSMFSPLSQMPEFWQDSFQVGILSALGVTVLRKFTS